jgi:hypothetical protein
MKTTKNILSLILLISVLIFTSCKSDSDDDENNDSSDSKITLKIDNGTETVYTTVTAMALNNKIIIGGNDADSDIQIIVDTDISEGTYTSAMDIGISHGVNSQAIFTSITNMTSLSFVVSNHNISGKHIKGTFSLNYDDNQNTSTHTATGTFDIYYQ